MCSSDLIGRIWRGEESLAKTYWIYGGIGLVLLHYVSVATLLLAFKVPLFGAILFIALEITIIWYHGLVIGGVWRSSARYNGNPIWKILARIMAVFGVFAMAQKINFLFQGIVLFF